MFHLRAEEINTCNWNRWGAALGAAVWPSLSPTRFGVATLVLAHVEFVSDLSSKSGDECADLHTKFAPASP